MKKSTVWWLPALFSLVLCLSACGGGGSPTQSSSATHAAQASGSNGTIDTAITTTGCRKTPPVTPGTSADATLTSGGAMHRYRLHIPAGYTGHKKLPLVVNIAGYDETALQQENSSNYSALADQDNFLVVYPQGSIGPAGKLAWATFGKADPHTDDVLFFSALLTTLQSQLCIDAQRIYAIGISNGGAMSTLLACQLAGRIAAFAAVAAAIHPFPGGCHPSRPVPYLEFHGTADTLAPYDGSTSSDFVPVMQTMQQWATIDGCAKRHSSSVPPDVTYFEWRGCQSGVRVEHYRISDGGHTWPGSPIPSSLGRTTQTISATILSWQFFQAAPALA